MENREKILMGRISILNGEQNCQVQLRPLFQLKIKILWSSLVRRSHINSVKILLLPDPDPILLNFRLLILPLFFSCLRTEKLEYPFKRLTFFILVPRFGDWLILNARGSGWWFHDRMDSFYVLVEILLFSVTDPFSLS